MRHPWARRVWHSRDVGCAAVLAAGATYELLGEPITPPGYVGNVWVDAALTAAVVVASLVRRRRPLLFVAVVTIATTGLWWEVRGEGELPFIAYTGYLLAAYTLGAHLPRSEALAAGGLALALWGIPDVIDARAGLPSVHQDVGFYILCALALGAGLGIAALRDQSATLRSALAEVERGRARREEMAAAEERRRIARDMHDVLTHSMSAVAVQAGALRLRAERERVPPDVTAGLSSVEALARDAMDELRRMLGALRERDHAAPSAPTPALTDLPELVESLQHTGITVTLGETGTPRPVPPGISLAGYRVVQEGLTNALRHGSGTTTVTVDVHYGERALTIEVRDDGAATTAPHEGHGLAGMQERVALYGGTLAAGPDTGGWTVRAELPVPA